MQLLTCINFFVIKSSPKSLILKTVKKVNGDNYMCLKMVKPFKIVFNNIHVHVYLLIITIVPVEYFLFN